MNWGLFIPAGVAGFSFLGAVVGGSMWVAGIATQVESNARELTALKAITSADAIADYQVWRNDVEWRFKSLESISCK